MKKTSEIVRTRRLGGSRWEGGHCGSMHQVINRRKLLIIHKLAGYPFIDEKTV